MFNLEQAIEQWRRQVEAAGLNSAEALDELECHLRDDVEVQVLSGLDTQSAFELAAQRLGTPVELSKEFAKSTQPEVAPRRTLLRYVYFICATIAILIDLWTLIAFQLKPAERVGATCGVTLFALYLFKLPSLSGWRAGIPPAGLLRVVKAMGVVVPLWILFALLTALGLVHAQIGIIPEMTLWSICAAYGLTVLALALNQSSGRQRGPGGGFIPLNPAPGPIPPKRPCPPGIDVPVPPTADFTPTARHALEIAREEALTLGHNYIGTEHLLLGLLRAAGGALAQAFRHNRVASESVRAEVRQLILALPARPATTVLPLTPRARKALRFAVREADALDHRPIGAEHILLGLLREGGGVAAVALRNLGIRLERLRTEISQQT